MKHILLVLPFFFALTSEAKTLKVMQYNAENFFDTKFDQGTDDYTYLPLSVKKTIVDHKKQCKAMGTFEKECLKLDWNETKFNKKAMNVAKVIKSYDETGKGPDILVLEEIENMNVIDGIVSKLGGLGYISKVLIEGDDKRGIDVALIAKFPVVSAKRHAVIHNGTMLDTRGILEVTLNVSGKKVVVFANHWPSQHNPTAERITSAKLLAGLADKMNADLIIAAGDFNSLDNEKPYPLALLKNFDDGEQDARDLGVEMIGGTHYYNGEWSSLDHIFIYKNAKLKTDYKKFQIMNRDFMMKKDSRSGEMIPYRANASTGEGFSDHLPMGVEFTY